MDDQPERHTAKPAAEAGWESRSTNLGDPRRPLARPNSVEIDADAMRHNLTVLRGIFKPTTKVFGTLKANAYGFGLLGAGKLLAEAGIDGLTVADAEDAIHLREHGVKVPILLYAGYMPSDAVVDAVAHYDIMPTVYNETSARLFAARPDKPVRVFVKLDVGLERVGVPAEQALGFVTALRQFPHITIAGVNTHLHVPFTRPDLADYLQWQVTRFRTAVTALQASGIAVPITMAESSGVLQISANLQFDAADPGQILFGLVPDGGPIRFGGARLALKAIKSHLIQVREVGRLDHYDLAPYPLRKGLRVGILPFGLRDGITMLSCDAVLAGGRRVPILGVPSLEYTRIDVTEVLQAKVGDEIVILGEQGREAISISEVTTYRKQRRDADLTIAIPSSLPRIYLSSGYSAKS